MYQTFNGWKRTGRVVVQGERGVYRNEYGDYMYHINQTVPRGSHTFVREVVYHVPRIRQVTYC